MRTQYGLPVVSDGDPRYRIIECAAKANSGGTADFFRPDPIISVQGFCLPLNPRKEWSQL